MALPKNFAGEGSFCSEAHRKLYREDNSRSVPKAVETLRQRTNTLRLTRGTTLPPENTRLTPKAPGAEKATSGSGPVDLAGFLDENPKIVELTTRSFGTLARPLKVNTPTRPELAGSLELHLDRAAFPAPAGGASDPEIGGIVNDAFEEKFSGTKAPAELLTGSSNSLNIDKGSPEDQGVPQLGESVAQAQSEQEARSENFVSDSRLDPKPQSRFRIAPKEAPLPTFPTAGPVASHEIVTPAEGSFELEPIGQEVVPFLLPILTVSLEAAGLETTGYEDPELLEIAKRETVPLVSEPPTPPVLKKPIALSFRPEAVKPLPGEVAEVIAEPIFAPVALPALKLEASPMRLRFVAGPDPGKPAVPVAPKVEAAPKQVDVKAAEVKAPEAKPQEGKPQEAKPQEAKPLEAKPQEAKQLEVQAVEPKKGAEPPAPEPAKPPDAIVTAKPIPPNPPGIKPMPTNIVVAKPMQNPASQGPAKTVRPAPPMMPVSKAGPPAQPPAPVVVKPPATVTGAATAAKGPTQPAPPATPAKPTVSVRTPAPPPAVPAKPVEPVLAAKPEELKAPARASIDMKPAATERPVEKQAERPLEKLAERAPEKQVERPAPPVPEKPKPVVRAVAPPPTAPVPTPPVSSPPPPSTPAAAQPVAAEQKPVRPVPPPVARPAAAARDRGGALPVERPEPSPAPALVSKAKVQPIRQPEPASASHDFPRIGMPNSEISGFSGFWTKASGPVKGALLGVTALLGLAACFMFFKSSGTTTAAGTAPISASQPPSASLDPTSQGMVIGGGGWSSNWGSEAPINKSKQISIYRPTANLSDYRLEFRAQIVHKAIGWIFRAKNPSDYYVEKLEIVKPGLDPVIALVKYSVIGGQESTHTQVMLPMKVTPDTLFSVRLDVIGKKFATYVQDQLVDYWTDDQITSGGVGFYNDKNELAQVKATQISHLR